MQLTDEDKKYLGYVSVHTQPKRQRVPFTRGYDQIVETVIVVTDRPHARELTRGEPYLDGYTIAACDFWGSHYRVTLQRNETVTA